MSPLLDALTPPVVRPENIVTVLGRYDDVTPFDSGKALIDGWKVPPGKRFHLAKRAFQRSYRPVARPCPAA